MAGKSYPTTLGGRPPIQSKRYLSKNSMEHIAIKVFIKLISLYHKMAQSLLGILEKVYPDTCKFILKILLLYTRVTIFMQRKLDALVFICTIFEYSTLVIVPLFLFHFYFIEEFLFFISHTEYIISADVDLTK